MTPVPLTSSITLSASTVLALAAEHIWHFDEQLDHPERDGVRHSETRHYLELWKEIRANVTRGLELSTEHLQELYDACTSGDYAPFLTSDELLAVLGAQVSSGERRAS